MFLLAVVAKPCIIWPVGQAVKTSPFHGGNPGSIPGRVTRKSVQPAGWADFFVSTSPAGNRSQTWVTGEEIIPIFELDEIVR